jgi:hypothetical protein
MDSSAFTASPLWVCKNRKNFKFVLAIEDSTYPLQVRPSHMQRASGFPLLSLTQMRVPSKRCAC